MLPKTSAENIGHITILEYFTSLVDKVAIIASTYVDVNAMETKGSECLIISLSNYFIELVGVDFVA